jgi:hypothetical protein
MTASGSSVPSRPNETILFVSSALARRAAARRRAMKKDKNKTDPPMRDHYDFTGGERGKHYQQYVEGTNIVILDPDVAELFPDSKAVNDALRELASKSAS